MLQFVFVGIFYWLNSLWPLGEKSKNDKENNFIGHFSGLNAFINNHLNKQILLLFHLNHSTNFFNGVMYSITYIIYHILM